jgi:hypothetical protein
MALLALEFGGSVTAAMLANRLSLISTVARSPSAVVTRTQTAARRMSAPHAAHALEINSPETIGLVVRASARRRAGGAAVAHTTEAAVALLAFRPTRPVKDLAAAAVDDVLDLNQASTIAFFRCRAAFGAGAL